MRNWGCGIGGWASCGHVVMGCVLIPPVSSFPVLISAGADGRRRRSAGAEGRRRRREVEKGGGGDLLVLLVPERYRKRPDPHQD